MERIMNTFVTRIDENHLIPYFEKPFWNFYEWTDESDNGSDITSELPRENKYELIINCAFVYIAEIYNKLLNKNIDTSITKSQIIDKFFDKKQCQFVLNNKTKTSSQLGNAFACLIGLGSNELLDNVVYNESLIPASLSTRCFVYDALLTNKEKYKEFIIQDIKDRYLSMLNDGATTFYETEDGHEAFGGAGSLCHGWSAIPIYYLNILLK
jgi:hypothetical protein